MGMFWAVEMSGDCCKYLMTKRPKFKVRDMITKLSMVPPKECEKLNFLFSALIFRSLVSELRQEYRFSDYVLGSISKIQSMNNSLEGSYNYFIFAMLLVPPVL